MSVFRTLMMTNTAADQLKVPLTFTSRFGGCIEREFYGTASSADTYYRTNNGSGYGPWISWVPSSSITVPEYGSVQLWNKNDQLSTGYNDYVHFRLSGDLHLSGNIQSLLNWRKDCPDYCFYRLFKDNRQLFNAPLLPATVIGRRSFHSMFMGCTYLTGDIELSVLTMQEQSLYNIFYRCNSLNSMKVNFTEWQDGTTHQWLKETSATGTLYKPSALPPEYGDDRIPEGWTVVNID